MFNKAILVGRLTAHPELKQTPSGVSVTSFSIAVNRSYTPKGEERKADYLEIVAWRQTAEFICKYFSKGSAILIEGSIQTRNYTDKNGQNRRAWEIVADSAHFVESKSAGGAKEEAPAQEVPTDTGAEDFAEVENSGDLPF